MLLWYVILVNIAVSRQSGELYYFSKLYCWQFLFNFIEQVGLLLLYWVFVNKICDNLVVM